MFSIGREISRRICVFPRETDKTGSDIQARSFMARIRERNVKDRQTDGKRKWAIKNESSIVH